MLKRSPAVRAVALAIVLLSANAWHVLGAEPAGTQQVDAKTNAPPKRAYVTQTVRGRVVWLADALQRGFGVTTEPAAAESVVALETSDGKLWPLVPDTRGRAFAVDERLRDRPLQLLVRRYEDVPMLQVIRVFERREDGLYEIDYWCDICAIPMYILKPCECCQGETRLRETKVENRLEAGG